MTEIFDAITFRPKKEGGFRAVKIGFAFLSEKGGMDIYLDALPLQNDRGNVVIAVRPQRERDNRPQGSYENRRDPNQYDDALGF